MYTLIYYLIFDRDTTKFRMKNVLFSLIERENKMEMKATTIWRGRLNFIK